MVRNSTKEVKMKTTTDNVLEVIADLLDEEFGARSRTFEELGLLTRDKGIQTTFEDGSEFQITVVRLKRATSKEEEADEAAVRS